MREVLDWATERLRKGVEFEIEGGIVRLGAEGAPHACAAALGCSLIQAQYGTVAIVGCVVVVVLVVRHYRRKRNPPKPDGWRDCE